MKITVIGGHGMIGQEMQKKFKNSNIDIEYFPRYRIDPHYEDHRKLIRKIDCDVVLNLACEKRRKEVMAVANIELPRMLAQQLDNKILLVHVSSDYVFDGKMHESYKPTDTTNGVNHYGITKELGELAVLERANSMIIRLSWVLSEKEGFLQRIMNQLTNYKVANVVADRYGTPTSISEIPQSILWCIEDSGMCKIRHIAGPDVMSWYQIARIIQQRKFPDAQVFPILHKDYEKEITPEYTALMSDIELSPWYKEL